MIYSEVNLLTVLLIARIAFSSTLTILTMLLSKYIKSSFVSLITIISKFVYTLSLQILSIALIAFSALVFATNITVVFGSLSIIYSTKYCVLMTMSIFTFTFLFLK